MRALYGGEASSLTAAAAPAEAGQSAAASGGGSSAANAKPAEDLNSLITGAAKDLADYQHLTAEGKLGEAGQKLEQLKRKLDELNARRK
jgi:hypothetical protein